MLQKKHGLMHYIKSIDCIKLGDQLNVLKTQLVTIQSIYIVS